MHLSTSLAATLRPSASAAFELLGRLTQSLPSLPGERLYLPRPPVGMLTTGMIRAALLEMGVGAAESDVALAGALAQTGLPLTVGALAEANAALARAPGAMPQAYALAKSLSLPTTPAALTALTMVLAAPLEGLAAAEALPERLRAWLGLDLEAGTPPEALARSLNERMLQMGRSTEHHLASAIREGQSRVSVLDARTMLLRLAQIPGDDELQGAADGLAAHLEGQQLLNQASIQAHANRPESPLYLAIPMAFGGNSSLVEMRFWKPNCAEQDEPDASAEAPVLRVTVRVVPPRLGRVQADLSGRMTGRLSCRLGVEKASAQRLLARHSGTLAEALSEAGWQSCEVSCRPQSEWPPLWHGGEALTTPRTCVDRHV